VTGPRPSPLPPGAARLFPHHAGADLDPGRTAPFLIGRLLEDGDGVDLRWLAASVSEADLAAWLACRGGRQLSARSRAYWRVVLGRPGARPGDAPVEQGVPEEAADLWPL
jgi:hypothetical protein